MTTNSAKNTLNSEEISFLQILGIDPNSENLKIEITNLIQKNSQVLPNLNLQNLSDLKPNSSQNSTPNLGQKTNSNQDSSTNSLSQILTKIYTQIIPELQKEGKTWDIDWEFDRKENKRYEHLKKRGCTKIIKVD